MSDGPARRVLDTLLAHDRAESLLRWLMVEGADPDKVAKAEDELRVAWDAYREASDAWMRLAVDTAASDVPSAVDDSEPDRNICSSCQWWHGDHHPECDAGLPMLEGKS
jgi:hypothetical protein